MSSGHCISVSQKGQTAIGVRVSTKNLASAFSGGAMKPSISKLRRRGFQLRGQHGLAFV